VTKPMIRKLVIYAEDILIEGGRQVPRPVRSVGVAAILRNPWAGQGFVEDLRPGIVEVAPVLGEILVLRLLEAAGGAAAVEAYGKAAVVGTNGEVEHASALIHTMRFGNHLREAVTGSSFLPFTNKRGGLGCGISVPMKHITTAGARSHFLTIEFTVPDAPGPDEVVVALGVATGGRSHHRIGDRYEDMKELGVDHTNRRLAETA
jgi:hypothetical protein